MDKLIELPIGDWCGMSREELLAMAQTLGDGPEFWLLVGFICGRYFSQAPKLEIERAMKEEPS